MDDKTQFCLCGTEAVPGSDVQMEIFPVSISTQSRNGMSSVDKNHMELCRFSCIHQQDAPR